MANFPQPYLDSSPALGTLTGYGQQAGVGVAPQLGTFAGSPTDTTLKAASGVAAFVPVAGPILSWIFQGADMLLARNDAAKAAKKAEAMYKQQQAREDRMYGDTMALKREELANQREDTAYNRAQTAKGWAWKAEDRNFTRAMGVFDHLTGIMTQSQLNTLRNINLNRGAA